MIDKESANFENADLISLISVSEPIKFSIRDEIERGQNIYQDRRIFKEQSDAEKIQPLYETKTKSLKKAKSKPPYYYRLICDTAPNCTQPTSECKHTGHYVLDRDILTRREHISFLAQPKIMREPQRARMYCYYEKKHFSPCTYRIEQLALPKKQRLAEFWNENRQKITPQKSENIARLLVDANFTGIERAIQICNDEKQKNRLTKKKTLRAVNKFRKKILREKELMIEKIALNVFKNMQEFLLTEHDLTFNEDAQILSNVIAKTMLVNLGYEEMERKSEDVLAKCAFGLADALSLWIMNICQVCNFGLAATKKSAVYQASPQVCTCVKPKTPPQFPIDDYMLYEASDAQTEYPSATNFEHEMYDFEGEFEGSQDGLMLDDIREKTQVDEAEELIPAEQIGLVPDEAPFEVPTDLPVEESSGEPAEEEQAEE